MPFLRALVAFPTVAGQKGAHEAQKAWLLQQATSAGLVGRDADTFVEIDLPARSGPNAPVLGLVVHGDVVPVVPAAWSFPPFALTQRGDMLCGRGVADDKGPLAVTLLLLRALAASRVRTTHTLRLLVGTTEESSSEDLTRYLAANRPPDLSLVLDSDFPVIIGEKAWNALEVSSTEPERTSPDGGLRVLGIRAGTATSIVPDEARLLVEGRHARAFVETLARKPPPEGIRFEADAADDRAALIVRGKAAHAGVNLAGGRNALVALARLVGDDLPPGATSHLLAFARKAGEDVVGTGLDLLEDTPLWGRYAVNVATLGPNARGVLTLTTNLRRVPPKSGRELRLHLEAQVARFAAARGIELSVSGYFDSKLWAVSPDAPIVKRLLAVHRRVTGKTSPPLVSGGGTYAKRMPNAVPFGFWPNEAPYPGHDVDEAMSRGDLERGGRILLAALLDLATGAPMTDPLGTPVVLP